MMQQSEETGQSPRIAVILAGGGSRRMGVDKAVVELGGRRLVDRAAGRLNPQVDLTLISGASDYGTGLQNVVDRDDGPLGPAAGLWSAAHWIKVNYPAATAFVTAPVDGPFVPEDLVARLAGYDSCAVACADDGVHPAFARWNMVQLLEMLRHCAKGKGLALQKLARDCGAKHVRFSPDWLLMNVNTPDDLILAEKALNEANIE